MRAKDLILKLWAKGCFITFAGVAEIKRLVAISGVSLLSLWFGLSAWDILGELITSEGVVTEATEGSQFVMRSSGLELSSGAGGVTNYYPGIVPSLAVPFAILVGFAVYGAWNLGGKTEIKARK